jgi:hypothetical protein
LLSALAVCICLLPAGCRTGADKQKKPDGGPATQPGLPGPATSVAARSPKELALAEFLKTMKLEGKPALIEFGIIGCELSEKGLDSMMALHKANAVPGLAFIRVEASPDALTVESYFRKKAPSFPVHRDSQSVLAKALSATAYPTFVLADKFGHIRYEGKYPQEDLVQWGKTLVAETEDPGGNVPQFGAKQIDVQRLLARKLPAPKGGVNAFSEYMGSGGLMLLFVDTSCPFCAIALKEMPMVSKSLAEQKIVAVVVNNDDTQAAVEAFYAKNDPGAPVVYDVGATTREEWNVHSVPIVVYISPARKLEYHGEAIWGNLGAAIEKTLNLSSGAVKFTAAGTGFG